MNRIILERRLNEKEVIYYDLVLISNIFIKALEELKIEELFLIKEADLFLQRINNNDKFNSQLYKENHTYLKDYIEKIFPIEKMKNINCSISDILKKINNLSNYFFE